MLSILFGNRTASNILLYLNESSQAFPTELACHLAIPLNMIQKQLERLERAGILESEWKGKKKIYSWNDQCPLLPELKKLVQKGRSVATDPADGTYLPLKDRVLLSESLTQEGEKLSRRERPRPFVHSFESLKSYARWRQKQKNPWLV